MDSTAVYVHIQDDPGAAILPNSKEALQYYSWDFDKETQEARVRTTDV